MTEPNPNLAIWNAVCKTDPKHTKEVKQRGGFTSINANSQVLAATEQFGPIGIGWGYTADEPIFHDCLVFVRCTLWHGSRDNWFGPETGGAEWKTSKGYLDSDAPKKATTDAVTKLLSRLGFNADVFLGLYDDNKYVEQARREFEDRNKPPPPTGPISEATQAWVMKQINANDTSVAALCKHFSITNIKALQHEQIEDVRQWFRDVRDNGDEQRKAG